MLLCAPNGVFVPNQYSNISYYTWIPSRFAVSSWVVWMLYLSTTGCTIVGSITARDLRMIDCQTRRLVDAPPQCQYVALSHVSDQDTMNFGNSYIYNYKHQNKTILPPKTVHGSIDVANQLGFTIFGLTGATSTISPTWKSGSNFGKQA